MSMKNFICPVMVNSICVCLGKFMMYYNDLYHHDGLMQ